jgi:hypothetical protein
MNECRDGTVTHRTACILTYGGHVPDIWLNYVVLAATLLVTVVHLTTIRGVRWWDGAALVGVAVFQVVLCLRVGCAGISIVWCAVAGWLIHEREEDEPGDPGSNDRPGWLRRLEDVLLTGILAVLVYYAGTAPPITTVAHFCALVLGALLSRGNRYCWMSDGDSIHPDAGTAPLLTPSASSS